MRVERLVTPSPKSPEMAIVSGRARAGSPSTTCAERDAVEGVWLVADGPPPSRDFVPFCRYYEALTDAYIAFADHSDHCALCRGGIGQVRRSSPARDRVKSIVTRLFRGILTRDYWLGGGL